MSARLNSILLLAHNDVHCFLPSISSLHHVKRVGAILHAGTVVANLDLDDPSKVKKARKVSQPLPQYRTQTGRGDKVHQVNKIFV